MGFFFVRANPSNPRKSASHSSFKLKTMALGASLHVCQLCQLFHVLQLFHVCQLHLADMGAVGWGDMWRVHDATEITEITEATDITLRRGGDLGCLGGHFAFSYAHRHRSRRILSPTASRLKLSQFSMSETCFFLSMRTLSVLVAIFKRLPWRMG